MEAENVFSFLSETVDLNCALSACQPVITDSNPEYETVTCWLSWCDVF